MDWFHLVVVHVGIRLEEIGAPTTFVKGWQMEWHQDCLVGSSQKQSKQERVTASLSVIWVGAVVL